MGSNFYFPKSSQAATNYSSFSDISNNHWAFWYIEAIYQKKVTEGCAANLYCPDQYVTRSQFVVYVSKANGISACTSNCTQRYWDVPPNHFFFGWIDAAYKAGIIMGGGYFYPENDITQSDALQLVRNATLISPTLPPSYFPAYSHYVYLNRAQMAGMIAWNFNFPAILSGQITKITTDSTGKATAPEEPFSGTVVKIWHNSSLTNPDFLIRSDENGLYLANLDIKKVTNNVKIQSFDLEKRYPAVIIGQQIAYQPSIKRAYASPTNSRWLLRHAGRTDCTKDLNSRMVQIASQENQRWANLYAKWDREHPDWSDEVLYGKVDALVRQKYTGGQNLCCTGFVSWVASQAGLVDKSNGPFFYTTKTTTSDNRIVGAKTLREWFQQNSGRTLIARDGNQYKVVLSPQKWLLQDLTKLQTGSIYMKFPPQGAGYSGHSAIVYPKIDISNKKTNTMNCDGSQAFISQKNRDLTDSLFYGAGRFECLQ